MKMSLGPSESADARELSTQAFCSQLMRMTMPTLRFGRFHPAVLSDARGNMTIEAERKADDRLLPLSNL
jgi:hypothetical protein